MTETSERIYENQVSREGWGPGPWDSEPDKIQFRDEATGLPCLIVRAPVTGALCGYVGVPAGHPFFGVDYGELDSVDCLYVHGGLTYAGECQPGPEAHSICHVPADGESDNVYWLGFDCAHAWDIAPAMDARLKDIAPDLVGAREYPGLPATTYKTVDYVRAECARLAGQIANAA